MVERRFSDESFPVVVAHRGASSTHPENTLDSFDAALRLGAQIVELDVRLTADRVPIVIHDPDVSRTTDGTGYVHELRFDQVRALTADAGERPTPIPSLAEVLELVSGRGAVALEIKNIPGEPAYESDGESIVEAALAEVERSGFAGPVLVLSFNPRSIAATKRLSPGTPTGFLSTEVVAPLDALGHVLEAGHDFVLPGTRALTPVGPSFVERAHAAGVRVGTWTVDQPEMIRTLLEWGIDVLASNDPQMALGVLAEWRG